MTCREVIHLVAAAALAATATALGFVATGAHDTRAAVEARADEVETKVQAGVKQGIEEGARNAADEILSIDYLDQKIEGELGRLAEAPAGAMREAVVLLERLEAILGPERVLSILRLLLETAGDERNGPPSEAALVEAERAARPAVEEGLKLLRALLEAPPAEGQLDGESGR